MQNSACLSKAPNAIRNDLGAIFISLELSRSTWLITSLSPGGGDKMSRHVARAGDVAGLRDRFAQLVIIQEAGLDGFWIDRGCGRKVSKTMSSIQPRSRRHVDDGERRPTELTERRWFGRCWHTSEANLGFAQL